jgi:hypothetical protein
MNNITTTLSDKEITKIKVIDFDEFYNFYVHNFLQLKLFNISKWRLKLLFFEIQNSNR